MVIFKAFIKVLSFLIVGDQLSNFFALKLSAVSLKTSLSFGLTPYLVLFNNYLSICYF